MPTESDCAHACHADPACVVAKYDVNQNCVTYDMYATESRASGQVLDTTYPETTKAIHKYCRE